MRRIFLLNSASFRSLISFDHRDIEDLPPDAFEITFPPVVTRVFTTPDNIEKGVLLIHSVVAF